MRDLQSFHRTKNEANVKTQTMATAQGNQSVLHILQVLFFGGLLLLAQTMLAAAQDRPLSFADLAESISPAVVNITTTTAIATSAGPQGAVPEGFEEFFRDFDDDGRRSATSLGSGFVISADGFIVTNNHVIEGADEILIEFFPGGGDLVPAALIGTDPKTDIALLKVDLTDLHFVPFGDSDTARVGDWVMAMGNPLGQGFSVSAGIVSARNRELSGTYDDYIQTDAAINRGNSGGPLFNLDGEVIGVNTAILSPTGGSIGIGFSMASNVVVPVVAQLEEFGETRRGWLGVVIRDLNSADDPAFGTVGALVTEVPAGPAADAGVLVNDVIVTFDGQDVPDTRDLVRMVGNAPVGKTVILEVLRAGELTEVGVTLGRRETAEAAVVAAAETEEEAPEVRDILGMTLSEITPEITEEYNVAVLDGLVIIDVTKGSDAAQKGLRVGDVLVEAGQQAVTSFDDLEARIAEATEAGRTSILVLVRRDGSPRFVPLSLE